MAKKSAKKRKNKFLKSLVVVTSAGTLLSSTALAGIPSKSITNTTTPRADQITLQLDNSESKPILLAAKKKVAKKKVAKKKTAKKKTAARKKTTARMK